MSIQKRNTLVTAAGVLSAPIFVSLLAVFSQPTGAYGKGFFSFFLLSVLFFTILIWIWRQAGSSKHLIWLMAAAFFLRFLLGIFFTWALPLFGYDQEVQNSGYLYADAFTRDGYAWQLASSGESLLKAFGDEFMADQYGGLLALSALVYRLFSPVAHRPLLMVIVGAGAAASGIPFFWYAVKRFLGSKTASISTWIMVLFPESLILGASQMREPLLISLFAVSFWSVLRLLDRRKDWKTILGSLIGVLGLLLISFRMALPIIAVLLIWAAIQWQSGRETNTKKPLFYMILLFGVGAVAALSWQWLRSAMHWDLLQTYVASGWIQYLFESLPEWMRSPFIIIYGIFQPLLPAAIADPAPWIWRVVGIVRGIGWYALLPYLVFASLRVWKIEDRTKKKLMIWLLAAIWGWVVLASIRAGGDQWDNPRYRTNFLPWMSIAAAWAVLWAKDKKDTWLWQILAVEGVFLLVFTHWYLSRYYNWFAKLPFGWMLALIVVASLLIIVVGWLWDRSKKEKHLQPPDLKP